MLTIIALTFGGLLDGAVLIETVFAWPGLGQYLTRGIQMNDINVVMGSVLMIGVVFLTRQHGDSTRCIASSIRGRGEP